MYNISGIQTSLNTELFGQHLVNEIIGSAMESHSKQKNPKKSLVMSFNGWTGSGKSFVSNIIAKHLFKKGLKSNFIYKKVATFHYRHGGNLQTYKAELKALIESSVKKCERSLFIFDEVDKMPEGLVDVLKPYLNHRDSIEGIDYRKSIFIFLSNAAGDKINQFTLKHLAKGKCRGDIKSVDMVEFLSAAAFKKTGGLKSADFILSEFVDFYVPFLPLERRHIKQCAAAEFKRRNISFNDIILEKVASEMFYFPEVEKLFSATGCKQIEKRVDLVI